MLVLDLMGTCACCAKLTDLNHALLMGTHITSSARSVVGMA